MRRPLASAALALLALLLASPLAALPALSADTSGVAADISLDPATAHQTVDVSGGATVATFHGHFDVTKQTVGRETVKLSIVGTTWDWGFAQDSYSFMLPSEGFDFSGHVTVPYGTGEGDHTMTVEVSWLYIDGLVRLDTAPLTLKVLRIPFTVSVGAMGLEVAAGGTARFDLTVVAGPTWSGALECLLGEMTASVKVGWVGAVDRFLDTSRLVLDPAGSATFSLEVVVPANATDGTLAIPVRVRMEDQPDYYREVVATVQVKGVPVAPPPEPAWWASLPISPWLLLTIVGLSLVVGLVGLFGGTEVGLLSLLWFLLPLFTRLRHREVLNQFTRGEIYGFIKANPGASLTAVRENLGLSNGVVAYHLRVLLREEYVVAHREGGYKRFYPRDMQVPRKRVHFTRLQVDIVGKVRLHPGIGQSELAAMLGESKQVVSYNLKVLVAAGVARVEREGGKARCYLVEGASILVEEEEGAGPEEAVDVEPEGAESAPARVPMRWQ
jgi:predicted transcriptional regulator